MSASRASIVAMLVAAEIVIAGIAFYALRTAHAASARSFDFVAAPIAPIEAGSAPVVAVDDPDSRVIVGTSTDGRVHVTDMTGAHGWFFNDRVTVAKLQVTRTADGVSIVRPASRGSSMHFLIGDFTQRVEIDVPAAARLEIARCSGADVSGVEGGVAVHSQDGRITLADLRGTVTGSSDDGSVSASRIRGDALAIRSGDGHLSLDDVAVASLEARTSDGSIEARALAIDGASPKAVLHSDDGSIRLDGSFAAGGSYDVSSNDGGIRVRLARGADLTVDASTNDGHVLVDGAEFDASSDAAHHTVKLGSGAGNLHISSDDGSIHILTNGAV